jgi:hypothetical protein
MLIKQLKRNKTDFENQGFNGSMANNDFTICSLLQYLKTPKLQGLN